MKALMFAVVVLGASGCRNPFDGIACTAIFVPGVQVFVTGPDFAVAKVVEGTYADSAVLKRSDHGFRMQANLAGERPGTYNLTVRSPGFVTFQESGIRVTKDVCHVRTRTFEVQLQPEA